MNLHYRVEKAFDDLENAIACAELHNSTSAADAERYAQLLEDIIDLRDSAKKEAAPAAGATEAAKSDSDKESTSSVAENGENVKTPYMNVRYICDGKYDVEIYATSVKEISSIYRAANDGIKGFTEQNCIPFPVVEFLADHINKEE